MLASNRMYARRHLAQTGRTGSAGSAGCAGRQAGRQAGRLKGSRQQRPNCVRNAMACYDDDDCRKEMHFRIEPRRRRAAAAIRHDALLYGGGSTDRGKVNRACAALQEYTL